ncbi:MAG: dTDP-4-dehydrorhamnose 3,5-epimerase [Flavobacteriales bacterium]
MKKISTPIEGLNIIEPRVFEDKRGYFFESFSAEKFLALGIDKTFIQDNQSLSQKGVLRGLHFQKPNHAQAKLVRVIKGAVLDVVVDIRKDSPTYGQHFAIELTEKNKKMLYIPEGFAHGFLTLEDNTIFSYKCSDNYHPECEDAILWCDEELGIDWNIKNPTVSDKDKIAKPFNQLSSPF